MMNLLLYISPLISFIVFFNFAVFYLDDFRLSSNNYIKLLQIITPILLVLTILSLYYSNIFNIYDILYVKEQDNNTSNSINIGANVEVIKQGAEAIARNIGYAGTVAGVAGAVGKAISKSSLPPIQKAGVVIASSIAGAGIHLVGSNINKAINNSNDNTNNSSSTIKSNFNPKFVDDSALSPQNTELMNVILGLDMITYACLTLIIILFMMILFKFYLSESFYNNIKLNLSGLIGHDLNDKFNYYIIKIIQLNKKTSNVYILIIFIVLFISLLCECYFITQLYNNLDKFIDLHINSRK